MRTVSIVIIQDQDQNDCKVLKDELTQICKKNGDCMVLIRIACRELESWYLGDIDAIEKTYPKFKASHYRNKSKFRDPDKLNSSYEIKRIVPEFQKGQSSKEIPKHMNIKNNTSKSFNNFITGLINFLN